MQQQSFSTTEQIQKKKFLTIRVHHLSYYEIELFYQYNKPKSIFVRFVMENHHDTPSPENNKPLVKHYSNILFEKFINHDASIRIIFNRSNEFVISSTDIHDYHVASNDSNDPWINIEKFDEIFTQLEFNIDHILALNKDIKEFKEDRRSDRKHDKRTFPLKREFYRNTLKQLEKERSETKKELRTILIGLYS